jgi:hypothetical protein
MGDGAQVNPRCGLRYKFVEVAAMADSRTSNRELR